MKKQNCLKQDLLLASRPKVQLGFCRLSCSCCDVKSDICCLRHSIETQAQDTKYSPLRVSSVTAQVSEVSTTITIVAEGSLRRAQTWQDREGTMSLFLTPLLRIQLRSLKGVKVRRLGQSLEILGAESVPGLACRSSS